MAILKNTTITDNGSLQLPASTTANRPNIITTIIQWTNTGTQAYTVLAGNTPTLTTTSWTAPTGVTSVEVLVVGGGGGGGYGEPNTSGDGGGGGGAGGLIYNSTYSVVPGNTYTVTVGQGGASGASSTALGVTGSNSVFDQLTADGGGGGGGGDSYASNLFAGTGGSGGGSSSDGGTVQLPGYPVAGQGNIGGRAFDSFRGGAGGGGAGLPGGWSARNSNGTGVGGGGGNGLYFSITGTGTWYAGGGGGAASNNFANATVYGGAGGLGGGGAGAPGTAGSSYSGNASGTAGTASTGGGGGGGYATSGGAGGSGTVVIRYNVVSDNSTPAGQIRYNTEAKTVEVYENNYSGWVAQDYKRNFGGHNLFAYSSTFTNASWLGNNSTVASNSTIAPDGTGNVYTATPTTGNTTHQLYYQTGVAVIAVLYTFSIYLKANGYTETKLADVSTGNGVWFNLSTGVVGTATSGFVGTIVSAGNSWYRCSITFTPSAGTQYYGIYIGNTTETASFAGDGTSGVFVWGAQLEQATSAGPYVRTLGANSPIPSTIGQYRYHAYTNTGTSSFVAANTGYVEVLVVGGGGGGGSSGTIQAGGGGGAGGVVYTAEYPVIAGRTYQVIVGAGGAAGSSSSSGGYAWNGVNGGNSQFGTIIAVGGGGGGGQQDQAGLPGGSGGGRASGGGAGLGGQSIIAQGSAGGGIGNGLTVNISPYNAGGGGGAGFGGQDGPNLNTLLPGYGGNGLYFAQFAAWGYPVGWFGGGGGAGQRNSGTGTGLGGYGGGGNGGVLSGSGAAAGVANTGGGGGGGRNDSGGANGGAGGSGIVIVRYRYD